MNNDINILIVEDDPSYAMLIKVWLKASGLENNIQHFIDGQEILNFLFDHHPVSDLAPSQYTVLLDINMPKINGIEVLKRIKSDELLRLIPVIMLTTADSDEEIDLCYKYGCNGYIVKPSNLKKLGDFLQINLIPKIRLKQNCSQELDVGGIEIGGNQWYSNNIQHSGSSV